ncbi:ribbon-helix-helix domain-containing protein [Pelomicrobium sp. P1]
MEKTQIYLRKKELAALREAARRSGRSVADLVREAIRKTVLKPGGKARSPSGTANPNAFPPTTTACTTSRDTARRGRIRRQRSLDRPRPVSRSAAHPGSGAVGRPSGRGDEAPHFRSSRDRNLQLPGT